MFAQYGIFSTDKNIYQVMNTLLFVRRLPLMVYRRLKTAYSSGPKALNFVTSTINSRLSKFSLRLFKQSSKCSYIDEWIKTDDFFLYDFVS